MNLFISLYCDACLKSSALLVGVKTLHNTVSVCCELQLFYLEFLNLVLRSMNMKHQHFSNYARIRKILIVKERFVKSEKVRTTKTIMRLK